MYGLTYLLYHPKCPSGILVSVCNSQRFRRSLLFRINVFCLHVKLARLVVVLLIMSQVSDPSDQSPQCICEQH